MCFQQPISTKEINPDKDFSEWQVVKCGPFSNTGDFVEMGSNEASEISVKTPETYQVFVLQLIE